MDSDGILDRLESLAHFRSILELLGILGVVGMDLARIGLVGWGLGRIELVVVGKELARSPGLDTGLVEVADRLGLVGG